MRMLKIIGYKVDVITDMEEKIKYCDYQLKNRLSIFKQKNILKNNYQMIFCDSKILEILLKLFNLKEKNKIIYIKNKTKMLDNKKEDSYDEVNIINETEILSLLFLKINIETPIKINIIPPSKAKILFVRLSIKYNIFSVTSANILI